MRASLLVLLASGCSGWPHARPTGAAAAPLVAEPLTRAPAGEQPLAPGRFTAEGWEIDSEACQIRFDLGRPYRKGVVEFEVRGPLRQEGKRVLFAAWNDPAGKETTAQKENERKAAFHQIRLHDGGMMLRLTHRPGGRSFEGQVDGLSWAEDRWYRVKSTWDTTGGESRLWLDGKEIMRGRFNGPFEGLRWVFLGRDNYRPEIARAVPGLVFRNLQVHGIE